ncbi:MAG: hypothetical protein Q9208_001207 [Pyrenodesmia sp. 3 TL-2023]
MSAPGARRSGHQQPDFRESPILRTLGYDFDFKDWNHIIDVATRAEEDFRQGGSLFMRLGSQILDSNVLRSRLEYGGQISTSETLCTRFHSAEDSVLFQALTTYATQVQNLAFKLREIDLVIFRVMLRAQRQAKMVKREGGGGAGEYEVESAFFPGRKIQIRHEGNLHLPFPQPKTVVQDMISMEDLCRQNPLEEKHAWVGSE